MLAGGYVGAAFDDLAFQIGGIDLELVNQFAVDAERRMGGFGLIGAMSVKHEAETVLPSTGKR